MLILMCSENSTERRKWHYAKQLIGNGNINDEDDEDNDNNIEQNVSLYPWTNFVFNILVPVLTTYKKLWQTVLNKLTNCDNLMKIGLD